MNTSKTNQSFQFRHNIPVYRMPDRAECESHKGVCPFRIGRVRESYVRRALAAVAKADDSRPSGHERALSGNHHPLQYELMNAKFTAVVKQRGEWWIGWIEEVPGVNAQERTKPELLKSLREALVEALEFNREEARRAAEGDYIEEAVMV